MTRQPTNCGLGREAPGVEGIKRRGCCVRQAIPTPDALNCEQMLYPSAQRPGLGVHWPGCQLSRDLCRAKATLHSTPQLCREMPLPWLLLILSSPQENHRTPPLALNSTFKGWGGSLTSEPQPTLAAESHPEGRGTVSQGHVECWHAPSCRDTLIRGCCHPGKRGNVFKACAGAKRICVHLPGSES